MNKKQFSSEIKEVLEFAFETEKNRPNGDMPSKHADTLTDTQYGVCLKVADYLHRRLYAPDHSVGYSGTLGNVILGLRNAFGSYDFLTEASIQIMEHVSHYTVYHSHEEIFTDGFKRHIRAY